MLLSKLMVTASIVMTMIGAIWATPMPGIVRERHIIHVPIKVKYIHHYKIKKVPIIIKKHIHYYKQEEIHHSKPIVEENDVFYSHEDDDDHHHHFPFHTDEEFHPKDSHESSHYSDHNVEEDDYEDSEQSKEEYEDHEYD